MKKRFSRIATIVLLAMVAFAMFPLSASAMAAITSPVRGSEFVKNKAVTIKVKTTTYTECEENQNYIELQAYSMSQNALKVLDVRLPYTKVGQTVSQTVSCPVAGTYRVYASEMYTVNGFKKYTNDGNRNRYILTMNPFTTIWADDATSFKVGEANALSIKGKTVAVKYSKLKKKKQILKAEKFVRFVNKGQGTLSYKKISGKAKISVNTKTGAVMVKKGLKRGKYKVRYQVNAAGDSGYLSGSKTVTTTVRVK